MALVQYDLGRLLPSWPGAPSTPRPQYQFLGAGPVRLGQATAILARGPLHPPAPTWLQYQFLGAGPVRLGQATAILARGPPPPLCPYLASVSIPWRWSSTTWAGYCHPGRGSCLPPGPPAGTRPGRGQREKQQQGRLAFAANKIEVGGGEEGRGERG